VASSLATQRRAQRRAATPGGIPTVAVHPVGAGLGLVVGVGCSHASVRFAVLSATLVAATLKRRIAGAALPPWMTIPAAFSEGPIPTTTTWEYSSSLLQNVGE